MIKLLVEFGIFTWDIFGTLNTLELKIEVYKPNYHSLCYTPGIYSVISPKDTAVVSEVYTIPQGRTSQTKKWNFQKKSTRASPVAQWLRIRLPVQRSQVWSLVQEDPICRGATTPVCLNYWACALEPVSHNYWSPCA